MQLLHLALVTPVLANATTPASSCNFQHSCTRAIGFTFLLPLVILHCVILSLILQAVLLCWTFARMQMQLIATTASFNRTPLLLHSFNVQRILAAASANTYCITPYTVNLSPVDKDCASYPFTVCGYLLQLQGRDFIALFEYLPSR